MATAQLGPCCHLCGTKEVGLQRCARCKKAWYCSKDHQRLHWKAHRKLCEDFASQGALNNLTSVVASGCSIDDDDSRDSSKTTTSTPLSTLSPNTSAKTCIPISFPISPASSTFYFDDRKRRFVQLADKVHDDLQRKGFCFIDEFLGDELCAKVFEDVKKLYQSGVMTDGEVVSKDLLSDKGDRIRDDKITWIFGREASCRNIAKQMSEVDTLIKYVKKRLDKYDIRGRSPAMVACYPGGGTHYVKHVDNPTGDGRCITTLYYLNKDWDCEKFGGQLRLYPYARTDYTDIEPFMDRLLLFWSDKRMPHEVIPSHRVRFAITLWYYDVEERSKATLKYYNKELDL